jgi:FkbM family methyltransferase
MCSGVRVFRELPVIKRLVPTLTRLMNSSPSTGGWTIRQRGGHVWLLAVRNYVDRRHLEPGGHEAAQLDFLFGLLDRHRPKVFLDIGANFGLYAINVASRYGCRTFALEPDRRNFLQLGANILLNRLADRIDAIPKAAAERCCKTFVLPADDSSTGQTRTSDLPEAGGLPVDAVAIDALSLPDLAADDWLAAKIDVEGAEPKVIEGMQNLLRRTRCVLQVEVMANNRARVEAVMKDLGYAAAGRIEDDWYFLPSAR